MKVGVAVVGQNIGNIWLGFAIGVAPLLQIETSKSASRNPVNSLTTKSNWSP